MLMVSGITYTLNQTGSTLLCSYFHLAVCMLAVGVSPPAVKECKGSRQLVCGHYCS
jgi:hypothetical protein